MTPRMDYNDRTATAYASARALPEEGMLAWQAALSRTVRRGQGCEFWTLEQALGSGPRP